MEDRACLSSLHIHLGSYNIALKRGSGQMEGPCFACSFLAEGYHYLGGVQ